MHFKFSSRLKSVIIWWRTKKSPPLNGFWLLGFHETGHECTNHLFLWPLVSASVAEAAAAVLPLSMTNHATFCSQSKIKLCAKPSEWFCSCREKGDGGKKMREDFFFSPDSVVRSIKCAAQWVRFSGCQRFGVLCASGLEERLEQPEGQR